jgi:hypothetical protein
VSDIGYDYEGYDDSAAGDAELDRRHRAAIDACLVAGLDLQAVQSREIGDVAEDIAEGEPWCLTELAGLQFYEYGLWDDWLEERVMPKDGDRLSLVRVPENAHDENAVEVWWRNGLKLGHLPRAVAAVVAGPLDIGLRCRAYIADGGTGEAWTAKALLVGEAVRSLHEKRISHVIADAIREHEHREWGIESRRRELGRVNGLRFREEQDERRKRRVVQAVNALLPGEPFEIEPPPLGWCELYTIEKALDVSRSTARRIAERAGSKVEVHRRGWYATGTHVEVTSRLQDAMREWAAHPVRRITHEDVRLSPGSIVAEPPRSADGIPF